MKLNWEKCDFLTGQEVVLTIPPLMVQCRIVHAGATGFVVIPTKSHGLKHNGETVYALKAGEPAFIRGDSVAIIAPFVAGEGEYDWDWQDPHGMEEDDEDELP